MPPEDDADILVPASVRAKMAEEFYGDEPALEVHPQRLGDQLKRKVKVLEVAPGAVLR